MWPFSQWTTAGRAALIYITMGALTVVWAGVWYFYLYNNPPAQSAYYWCTGFMVTGVIMVLIGLVLAKISHWGLHTDPSASVPVTVTNLQPITTTPAPAPAPLNLTPPVVALHPTAAVPPPEQASLNLASPADAPNGQAVLVPTEEPFAGLGERKR